MSKILENKVFISTRPEGRSAELETLLTGEGATLINMPTIQVRPLPLDDSGRSRLQSINSFNWIVFTSPNALKYFFDAFCEIHENFELPKHLKIAAVGEKTASGLDKYGYSASFINKGNTAEDFAADFFEVVNQDERVLLPVGNLARTVIEDKISGKARCTRMVIYETCLPESVSTEALNRIVNDLYDMIIVTSPSGCINLLKLLDGKTDPVKLRIASIGETTSSEVLRHGIKPLVTAAMASSQGIFSAIVRYFSEKQLKSL